MELSTNHLPAWLQRAMRAPGPTRVEFPASGYVAVFPDQGRYATNIEDWASPSLLASDGAEMVSLPPGLEGQRGQPLSQLHWTLTLQRLQQEPQQYPFQFSMVRLVSWPSLTHLPEDVLPPVARLCALLARKPSTASLLPLMLGLPEAQVFALIEALRLYGHVQVASTGAAPDSGARAAQRPAEPMAEARSSSPSLIGKLWQRLVTRP